MNIPVVVKKVGMLAVLLMGVMLRWLRHYVVVDELQVFKVMVMMLKMRLDVLQGQVFEGVMVVVLHVDIDLKLIFYVVVL